jgi:hypothetical protein
VAIDTFSRRGPPLSVDERRLKRDKPELAAARSDLGGRDRVIIYENGTVTDADGNEVGNIHDEV